MSISAYLDRAKKPDGEKRWGLWIREWDGVDQPHHYQIAILSDDHAKALENASGIHWKTVPDWQRLALEKKRVSLMAELEKINTELKR